MTSSSPTLPLEGYTLLDLSGSVATATTLLVGVRSCDSKTGAYKITVTAEP